MVSGPPSPAPFLASCFRRGGRSQPRAIVRMPAHECRWASFGMLRLAVETIRSGRCRKIFGCRKHNFAKSCAQAPPSITRASSIPYTVHCICGCSRPAIPHGGLEIAASAYCLKFAGVRYFSAEAARLFVLAIRGVSVFVSYNKRRIAVSRAETLPCGAIAGTDRMPAADISVPAYHGPHTALRATARLCNRQNRNLARTAYRT